MVLAVNRWESSSLTLEPRPFNYLCNFNIYLFKNASFQLNFEFNCSLMDAAVRQHCRNLLLKVYYNIAPAILLEYRRKIFKEIDVYLILLKLLRQYLPF
jgi:hypothetical protein